MLLLIVQKDEKDALKKYKMTKKNILKEVQNDKKCTSTSNSFNFFFLLIILHLNFILLYSTLQNKEDGGLKKVVGVAACKKL